MNEEKSIQAYLLALCDYFRESQSKRPYHVWFDVAFENKLQRIGTSYYHKDGISNIALHIDLCSSLATIDSWSKFEAKHPDAAQKLSIKGANLCKELVAELKPQLILANPKTSRLDKAFKRNKPWRQFNKIIQKRTQAQWTKLSGGGTLIVQGNFRYWNADTQRKVSNKVIRLLSMR